MSFQLTSDQHRVYEMLNPKPKMLLYRPRTLIRHGQLTYYSPNTDSTKPRYFFLFHDCLLISKKISNTKYRLRVFVHLRSNIRLYDREKTMEFRLLVPTRRGTRHIIMFAQNSKQKADWLRDLKHCLWIGSGRIGPDPSGITPYNGPTLAPEQIKVMQEEHLHKLEEEDRRLGGGNILDSDDEQTYSNPKSVPSTTIQGHHILSGSKKAVPEQTTDKTSSWFDPIPVDTSASSGNLSSFFSNLDLDPFANPSIQTASVETAGYASAYNLGSFDQLFYTGTDAGSANRTDHGSYMLDASKNTADAMKNLFEIERMNKELATKSEEILAQEKLESEAQNALREATATIEAIINKLSARPRFAPTPIDEPISTEEVSDALMDSTSAIAEATKALLSASMIAQTERILMGKKIGGSNVYYANPQWTNGLISAAQNVVAATKYMVQCADDVTNGHGNYETLISSAHAVTASTAKLVTAQRVNATNDVTTQKLETTAKGINNAIRQLCDQVRDIADTKHAPVQMSHDKYSLSRQQIREIEIQAKAIAAEEEARRAREELARIRSAKYQKK